MDIVDALDARHGTICFVGAGGKKTTMATLAARLEHAVVTATVRIPIFDGWVEDVVVTETPRTAIDEASAWPLGVVPAQERPDRYRGYDPGTVADLADIDHPILVKADGARMREFKAPSDREPQLPTSASTVVPIASAHVVGEPLTDDIVHRVDEVTAITGLARGDEIRPQDVAAVLAHEQGGLKDVPANATAVPLLNMVDDAGLETSARAVAEAIHDQADVSRVVLAEMRSDDPLVAVV
ncbi:putative selenium-dependent hydroxylase accessory protein YqeC [Haloarcula quadrata]|jgi:probable selenium-dependent hydroxylase accessory protein YqeC|uniref:Putative selenium-dependent hydroxylase accessory protein YqeC n=1 Tax=Haloarcula quadrata TaxID=182779 RepID=A0A495R6T2_9EURY|nr:selenium cofactor biosynthesis protein YqeC [Haloarcula quadrata]RKS82997.1 putative selenium-dependent hydroxylase accessory protein YqeC [Haloarcula quadrata]